MNTSLLKAQELSLSVTLRKLAQAEWDTDNSDELEQIRKEREEAERALSQVRHELYAKV